jgi:hypothetical protein
MAELERLAAARDIQVIPTGTRSPEQTGEITCTEQCAVVWPLVDRHFEMESLDPCITACAFTFG